MAFKLDAKIPAGALAEKWSNHKAAIKVVSPANKRKLDIIIVGTGLGGASAAASLGELGYNVKIFCIQDSPRRAHSIAAQGGINAAKNYQNDNDSVYRLFYDTIKGGDYRAREANVYRLAEVSNLIIDQCVAQGVPFAREYGGLLANRSFGGAQVSRTFYARGQTGQQLLLGAYSVLNKEIAAGTVKSYPRHEMLDIVIEDGEAKGIINESVRGDDIYILLDVCNYSLTYSLCGYTNHMSPDDHFQDLKRVIAAIGGKARRINVIMPFLYESRQHKRSGRESLDCALGLQELTAMGVENIITFDAHDPRVQNAIPLHGFETLSLIHI